MSVCIRIFQVLQSHLWLVAIYTGGLIQVAQLKIHGLVFQYFLNHQIPTIHCEGTLYLQIIFSHLSTARYILFSSQEKLLYLVNAILSVFF